MKKGVKNAFRMEEKRAFLASTGNFRELKKTYSRKYPEIPDLNTPKLWDKLNNRAHIDESQPMAYRRHSFISKQIPNENIKVLNAACGSGDLESFVFKRQNKHEISWYGVDTSSESIKTCKKEFKGAKFSLGDVRKLKFKNNFFDIVIASEILEHIVPKNTFKVLNEFHRVLKKNGKFIVSIPLNEGLEAMVGKGENPNAHVRVYTPQIMKAELEMANFKVVKEKFMIAFPNFYLLKTFIVKFILKGYRKPNKVIIIAKKST